MLASMQERISDSFIFLSSTKKSLKFSTQASLQSKWITKAILLISKFSAQWNLTENRL